MSEHNLEKYVVFTMYGHKFFTGRISDRSGTHPCYELLTEAPNIKEAENHIDMMKQGAK